MSRHPSTAMSPEATSPDVNQPASLTSYAVKLWRPVAPYMQAPLPDTALAARTALLCYTAHLRAGAVCVARLLRAGQMPAPAALCALRMLCLAARSPALCGGQTLPHTTHSNTLSKSAHSSEHCQSLTLPAPFLLTCKTRLVPPLDL